MKKLFILVVLSLTLSACSPERLFSMLARSDIEQSASDSVEQSSQALSQFQQTIDDLDEKYDESVYLGSQGDDTSYAHAYRNKFSEDGFMHEVFAVLPPFENESHFYEGWLVNPTTQGFISTGPMKLNDDGKSRLLEFTSSTDYINYSKVIITIEKDTDPAPGEHILEGEFN
ncbi:hypothetical protein ACFL1M_00845 [Patescibacteria group bacterium]